MKSCREKEEKEERREIRRLFEKYFYAPPKTFLDFFGHPLSLKKNIFQSCYKSINGASFILLY